MNVLSIFDMVRPKTSEEIELLRINGDLVSRTLAEVGKLVAPGVTTERLNEVAETFIRDHGAEPSFKGFEGFPAALCMSVNDVVVHGFPSDYVLKEGDILSVDCGTLYKGYNGDSAYTFPVGEVDAETRKLLDVTKASLYKGIEAAVAGGRTLRRLWQEVARAISDTRCSRTQNHSVFPLSANLKDTALAGRCTRNPVFPIMGEGVTAPASLTEWLYVLSL